MKYDFNGEEYKQASDHQKDWGLKIINCLDLNGDESILDLGCGDGFLAEVLADRVPNGRVVGIDASSGMISTAKKIKKTNLYFEKMDINNMSFNEEFDIIFSNAVLHWLLDHKKLLINCYRALTPNGFIRFNFAGNGNCANFFRVVQECIQQEQYKHYFETFIWPWYTPPIDEYTDFIKITNYRNCKVWEDNEDMFFSDQEKIIRWIDNPSLVPFIKQITAENDRVAFRNDVIEKMLDQTRQENGTFFETFRRINVYAMK